MGRAGSEFRVGDCLLATTVLASFFCCLFASVALFIGPCCRGVDAGPIVDCDCTCRGDGIQTKRGGPQGTSVDTCEVFVDAVEKGTGEPGKRRRWEGRKLNKFGPRDCDFCQWGRFDCFVNTKTESVVFHRSSLELKQQNRVVGIILYASAFACCLCLSAVGCSIRKKRREDERRSEVAGSPFYSPALGAAGLAESGMAPPPTPRPEWTGNPEPPPCPFPDLPFPPFPPPSTGTVGPE